MNHALVPMNRPGSHSSVVMSYAMITGRAGPWYFIQSDETTVSRAQRADSCLIEPECGDTVLLCAGCAQATPYVLAVLVRATGQSAASLVLPGEVALHTEDGALRVDAKRIELQASERVGLEAPEIGLTGLRGEIKFARFDAVIQQLHAGLGSVRTFADKITQTVGRLVVRARDSLRWIEDTDETRAVRMRVRVSGRYHMNAKHATVLAEGQVKIDAAKIDLG